MVTSDRLAAALEQHPNLANRALVMLLQDPRNVEVVEKWIIKHARLDIRFARLGETAGIKTEMTWVDPDAEMG